jgi:uncharacterized membrane protein YraQ (UPF0718 family)
MVSWWFSQSGNGSPGGPQLAQATLECGSVEHAEVCIDQPATGIVEQRGGQPTRSHGRAELRAAVQQYLAQRKALVGQVAIVAGWVIGRLQMERHLEDWVRDMPRVAATAGEDRQTLAERIDVGLASVREIVGKVWPYILAGIAIGAAIHGWVPQDFMASIMGKDAPWWSVPLAVLIGVPMYTNAAGVIPIVQALLAKGAALGTVLAFMMSVIALSLPEMIILRKVLKVRLIATFAGVVATGILIVGYVFNAVL